MRKLILAFLFFSLELQAQDMQLTQFYAAPMYLNPAYTGLNACSRISSNYRNQWGNISGGYVSQIAAYEHFLPNVNSGIGVMLTNDQAGTGKLRSYSINGLYSYEINIDRKRIFRMGAQASWVTQTIDFYKLVFGDQLARGGALTSIENPGDLKTSFLDFSTGALLYSEKYWVGFSALHLTTPDMSFMNTHSPLPIKYSIHGGAKIPVKNVTYEDKQKKFLTPAFLYKFQEKFDQVDLGFYVTKEPFVAGLWYRGIPGFKAYKPGYQNNDAIAAIVGFTKGMLKLGYSYDFTISRLVLNSAGSHELSLSYQFCKLDKKKRKFSNAFLVPCPKF